MLAATAFFAGGSTALAQPANDNCTSAQVIGDGNFPFDTSLATNDAAGSCGLSAASPDVWFSYTPTADGPIVFSTCGSGYDTVLSAYDSCGGVELLCLDDFCGLQTQITVNGVTGVPIIVRVSGFNGASGAGSLLAQGPGNVANDNCVDATAITSSTTFSTIGATTDGSASCGFNGDPGSADVWFMYTPGATDTHVFDTCDATFDTILSVYDSCGGGEIGCNDDSCGLQSRLSVPLTQGVPVLVRIAGFDTEVGSGTLNVQVGVAGNDDCAGAIEVAAGDFPFDTTTATNDTAGTCGASGTSPDIWFSFLPTETGSLLVNTCGSGYDTVLSAYDSCGGVSLVCNDDFCGLQSQIIVPVTQDVRVFIRVSGFAGSVGTGTLHVEFLTPPANDNCADATPVFDGDNAFNSVGATSDGFASCGFGGDPGSSDVWFAYTATSTGLMAATTCPGGFDTIMSVLDSCGGAELACNDDTSTGLCSRVFVNVTQGTTYLIRVAGFGTAAGVGNLNILVSDPPAPCVNQPMGAILETEICGEDTNGGCNNAGNLIQSVPNNAVIFGTAWADNGTRDTDWYEITLTERSLITVTLQSEFVGRTFILSGACPAAQFGTTTSVACGAPATLTATVNAGTYRIFAGHNVFADTPCALSGNTHYVLTIDAGAIGACCTATGCQATTSGGCAAQGGVFQGGGTTCGGQTFTTADNAEAFEDISGSGVLANVQCDDCTASNNIGFTFRYRGTDYTTVNVSSNGNIQFPPSASGIFGNVPIPAAALPNNMIAPAWDDFNPGAGGTVYAQTDGAAPNRRFIVSWQDIPQFANADANSFQVILHETTNRIEFRYGTMTFQAAGDITVGVENIDGTDGLNLDATTVIADGNRAITINAMNLPNPCAATGACCMGDGSCTVLTAGACASMGGSYQGDDVGCGMATYEFTLNGGSAFEDISATGTLVTTTGDDALFPIALAFPFTHYGTVQNTVNFCTNGNLQFPPSNSGAFGNLPIPNAAVPNNMLAVLWDDFNLNINTIDGMHHEVRGTPGNLRHIFQWTNVAQFGTVGADVDLNTFQCVIFQDGHVEFRYSDTLTDLSFEGIAGAPGGTVGVEDAGGTAASVQFATGDAPVSPGSNIRVNPVFLNSPCSADPCAAADFNNDGVVNADDLGDYINCYFSIPPCDDAEVNNDGVINADDLGDFINLYFGCD
ncbi:MAG: hypothetical protein AB7K52_02345 [Phycisphaerales bacterium]